MSVLVVPGDGMLSAVSTASQLELVPSLPANDLVQAL